MKNKLYLILSALLILCLNGVSPAKDKNIVLTSEIINIIDGFPIPWGIDANVIKLMLHVRREIKKIQFGDVAKDGKQQGHYTFKKTLNSVRTLAVLESKYEAEYYQKLQEYNKNPEKFHKEIDALNAEYNEIKKQLKESLDAAKKEFDAKIAPFCANAKGGKEQMLILIEESCKKRNRTDCFILKWGEAEEGNETKLMHEQITTFKAFDQFCTDLVFFLEDLMGSCKKAWGQFKKLMDEEAAAAH
jgi:hypothetical protein